MAAPLHWSSSEGPESSALEPLDTCVLLTACFAFKPLLHGRPRLVPFHVNACKWFEALAAQERDSAALEDETELVVTGAVST